ncbi:outer membrane beta-barrel protein [Mesorhizobium sp. B283B1A]|uniref:outer membrane protein n=1 Tax=Mesorhizobium TaxID=68287 RepID=UPI001CD0C74B|nr:MULTISPECIES: outer membrane beta-barrel protein [Mesorhizobium]MCA0051284.1 outer membrane beta-barrel protein [Mesorhizobium sp. B283B1A]UQS63004.1 outer membrane beta-barrel protein [Mesorhizobium opportunistum]
MTVRVSAKSIFLGAVSVLALMSAAHAADVVQPVEASGFNWSGAYIGIGGGFGASVHKVSVDPLIEFNGIGGNGVFGELTAGYDHMVSERFLLGGFIDANGGNIGPSISVPGGDIDLTASYGFDVGVRAGYLLNPSTLGYVLGGYSWQHFKLDGSGSAEGLNFAENRSGYVLGVGLETVLRGNWTLKTEYRYADYGDKSILDLGGASLNMEPSTHTFHIAANYRFGAQNGGGASFAAPAYNWTGFYVGGALGAGTMVHDLTLASTVELNGIGGEGVFGEASVGYDQDFGSWVAGVQLDARYSGIRSKLDIAPLSIKGDADYGFDALARVGAKVNDSTLAYVLGGYSWQHFKLHGDSPVGGGDIYDWGSSGFSVGGGLETAVSNNMTVGLEYRYSQYQKEDFGSGGVLEDTPSFQTVRIGAKYKFN